MLESPHSLIQVEKEKKKYTEVSQVKQKNSRWGAGRNGMGLGRMIPEGIKGKRQEGQSSDCRMRAEKKSELDEDGASSPPEVFL